MKKSLISLAAMLAVSACATTGTMTAQERARCQEMARTMGAEAPHDHQAERSGMASSMNGQHERCRTMAQADAPVAAQ